MLTFADLQKDPGRLKELGGHDVLIAASGGEVLVQDKAPKADATVVFMHETIAMMRAERAEKLEKIKSLVSPKSVIVPLVKNADSMWDNITVGRASTADITLDDPAASNVHAHFMTDDDDKVTVQDVGSSNGTYVNRERLQANMPVSLRSGDCVRFGQTIFYYVTNAMLKELAGG